MNNLKRLVNKSNVPEDGTCTICCSLMFGEKHDPRLFNPCNHLFCTSCNEKVGNKCPICRSKRKGPSRLHQDLREQIGNLRAHCKGHGCSVEGTLHWLPFHESSCRFCEHTCQYCGQFFPRGTDHEMQCKFRCRHCRAVLLYKDTSPEEHEKVCHRFPVACPSQNVGCPRKVPRDEMEAHVRTCPFHQIRDFLRMRQLQYEKVTLQMLTVQKSEVLIRKEHLEAIVKHQKLLGKYQDLFKEHVNLMEKMKNETTKERDYLLLMKRSRGTEAKYIQLSEQFILLGERKKKLHERILGMNQQVRRDAISQALSEDRAEVFNGLLEEFIMNAKVHYQLQHVELLTSYKNFLTNHEQQIKKSFETMLNKSEGLFIDLYGDIYKQNVGDKDAIKTLKENDLQFLGKYQRLMTNQIAEVSTLLTGFIDKHMGMQKEQLEKLSNFFGMINISSDAAEIPPDILEGADLRHIAPQVLRSYNINQLERKIKLLEGLRDGVAPITEEALRNAIEQEPEIIINARTEDIALEIEDEIKLPPEQDSKPVYEVNPNLQLDINEFRVRPLPPAPKFELNLNRLVVEPLEEVKEPLDIPFQETSLTEQKEEADEKTPLTLSLNHPNGLLEPSGGNTRFSIDSSSRVGAVNNTDGRFNPVDVGPGVTPLLLDPEAVAVALKEGSRRLLGIKLDEDAKSEEVD